MSGKETSEMSATFHPFPRLPAELRIRIWGLSVEHRTVDVRATRALRETRFNSFYYDWIHVDPDRFIPVPVPGVMHACQESRHLELYEKVLYTTLSDPPEERYAWINFDMDMIDLYHDSLFRVEHLKDRIRQLRLERCPHDEHWFYEESPHMQWFENLQVCHVVARTELSRWYRAWYDVPWKCPKENLKYTDRKTGQMMGGDELDEMVDEELADLYRHEEAAEWNSRINDLFA